MPLIRLTDVSIAYGVHALLDQAGFQLDAGERVGLIGRNGEGKSTLLKIIDGEVLPDHGEVWLQPGLPHRWPVWQLAELPHRLPAWLLAGPWRAWLVSQLLWQERQAFRRAWREQPVSRLSRQARLRVRQAAGASLPLEPLPPSHRKETARPPGLGTDRRRPSTPSQKGKSQTTHRRHECIVSR